MVAVNVKQKGPIFIVGMNGSGTTMLADCLDNSPEFYAFPRETRMVPWLIEHLAEFGDLTALENLQKLLDTFCAFHDIRMILGKQKPTIESVVEPTLYGVIDAVYLLLAKKQEKTRWIEKSPMNIQFVLPIADQIPTAKFIHIYRDGRDVAQSNQRRWHKNPYLTIYRWKQVVQQGQKDGKQLGDERYFEVSYEQLTAHPEETMVQICSFVDIDYHPSLLLSSMPFVNSVYVDRAKGKVGTIVATGAKWKTYFSARQVKTLEKISGALLEELGYTPTNCHGDSSPPVLIRKYWRMFDIMQQGLLVLGRYKPKRRMAKRFIDGLKYISIQRY